MRKKLLNIVLMALLAFSAFGAAGGCGNNSGEANSISPAGEMEETSFPCAAKGEGDNSAGPEQEFKLGNEVLLERYRHLVEGKRVGLVTNQSGVDRKGKSTMERLHEDSGVKLAALYGPEHGIDGKAGAGEYVESYVHEELGIPVYSLYGKTRKPTAEMLQGVDVLLYDIQDIGARSYTFISTLNYCMAAAQEKGLPVVVLDRPNPLGGMMVEGPVLEERFRSFVGVDHLPKAHGMTVGELARFFNRKIGADLTVVPMEGYRRNMLYQDTGLTWVQTSPNIPDLEAVFGYMATGLGEGTGVFQADKFRWIGGRGIDAVHFAALLNEAGLEGVRFIPEVRGEAEGVRLHITDYYRFNPARTGIYALTCAFSLGDFQVPKSEKDDIVMFDKIMGTDQMGQYLEQGLSPQEIEARFAPELRRFKEERQKYLLAEYAPSYKVRVWGAAVDFDSPPYIDSNNRLMVPVRAIAEALGADVGWDPEYRKVAVDREGKSVLFTIDSARAEVDGAVKTMDTIPVIRNGRTMIPVRYVSEYLGVDVDWNPYTLTVSVN